MPATGPSPLSTNSMKLPADGSARVNSATPWASRNTAAAAARMVSGAPTPAVTAMTPKPK